jgi:hypothetical protein
MTGTVATATQNSITTMTGLTTTGALGAGSIAAGFGAIDNGTSNIRSATITAETAFVPDASGGADLGTSSLEFNDLYLNDVGTIFFGDGQDISLTHYHNNGLILKNTNDGAAGVPHFIFQSGDTDIAANDYLGTIQFQAPDEGTGTDAILIAAAIDARAEGNFAADNNATSLHFRTGASETATDKLVIKSDGDVTVSTGDLVFATAGKGVVLGATSNTDANTLDDYEEGTWTPSVAVGQASVSVGTVHQARYSRIGKTVTLCACFDVTADDPDSGDVRFAGLPFPLSLPNGGWPVSILYNYTATPTLFMSQGGYVYYQNDTVGGNNQQPLGGALHSTQVFSMTFSYITTN